VYAIVSEEPAVPLEDGLRLVRCGEVLAVVGEAEAGAVTPEALAAHDAVVRRLAGRFEALLPVRFGQHVQDERDLATLLGPRSRGLAEALERVRGCEQMTLRVFGDPDPVPEPPEPDHGGPGTRYLEARRREAERARSLPEIEPLRESLQPLLRAERIERREQGQLLGSVYHLVLREDVPAYLAAVRGAEGHLGGRRVTVSGPWPPYAFAPGLGERP
jgi:hypothetical protein